MEDSIFSPSFGNRPSQLVGRNETIELLLEGLASKPGSKERATLLLGQRGSGKTVMLWELADRAREAGFVVASPTVVAEDMPERIIEKIQDDGERYMKGRRGRIVGDASRISDIAKRMGATEDYAQKYRRRLIDSGIIEAARRGYVAFAVPLMAQYLKERF